MLLTSKRSRGTKKGEGEEKGQVSSSFLVLVCMALVTLSSLGEGEPGVENARRGRRHTDLGFLCLAL